MAILPTVGRRVPAIRSVVVVIYALLVLGGLTMVVPFLITLTASVSNELDYQRYDVLPAYLWRDDLRFGKYLAEKYAVLRFEHFAAAHGAPNHWSTFKDLGFERRLGEDHFGDLAAKPAAQRERIAADYDAFMAQYDGTNVLPLFSNWGERTCQAFLRRTYEARVLADVEVGGELSGKELSGQALDLLSRTWNEGLFLYWDFLNFQQELRYPYHLRRWAPPDDPRQRDYLEFLASLPSTCKIPVTAKYLWCIFLLDRGVQVPEIDRAHGTDYGGLYRVPAGDTCELPAPLAALWREFTRDYWPLRLTEIPGDAGPAFHRFLARQYASVEALNRELGTDFASLGDVPFSVRLPARAELRRIWVAFASELPPADRRMLSAEGAYRRFLRERYTSVDELNQAYGWSLASFAQAELPLRELDYHDYARHRPTYFGRFLSFNFGKIMNFITVRGRALPNTLVLVVLTIVFTLTVNPLAAYALSRFRLRATQQILVYLLATMAFPPEVGMIPSFLLLRDLHLLNTFSALILPGVASGFSIFLLKGFFDSLPQELYEAASIDGASEMRMFWRITLPLCAPILSVIALQAFIRAYGSFMWAFIVCQDPDYWTLMVWLYQFQAQYSDQPYLIMSAIVVASVPTLLVFVFCQKIILRGIIIPTMK